MADYDKPEDKEKEFRGPGKFTSTVGKGATEGIIGNVAGSIIGAGIGAVTGMGAYKGAQWGAGIGTVGGVVHGGYKGYSNSANAKEDHKNITANLGNTRAELAQQKNFVKMLSDEKNRSQTDPKVPTR